MKVKCPACKKEVEWNVQNPFRPFCSERCKILDLGAWAMEKHAIPEVESETQSEAESVDDDSFPNNPSKTKK
jgi:endogenous inhibitor of DNA gyrase (YacG/DUF329 family)